MKEYKLCSDKCCASFFPCWQNCSSCLTSRRTDPWRDGRDCSSPGFLLCNIALSIRNHFANSEVLFAYRINHLRCSWALSKAPCWGRGARGRITSGSKQGTHHILNQQPASPLQKKGERKKMLSASQLLQQAVLAEKCVKSRLDQILTTSVLYAKRTYIVHLACWLRASPPVLSMHLQRCSVCSLIVQTKTWLKKSQNMLVWLNKMVFAHHNCTLSCLVVNVAQQFAVHMLKKKECNKYSGFPRPKKTWEILGYGFQDMVFRTWDLNFGTWISHRGLHMIQDLEFFWHMIFRTWMGNQATSQCPKVTGTH